MFEVPDLTGLTEDELSALAQQIQDEAAAHNSDGAPTEEATTDLERLAEAYQQVLGELESREEAAQVRAERAQQALGRIGVQQPTDTPDDPTVEDAPADDGLDVIAEPIAATTSDPDTFAATNDEEDKPMAPKDPARRRTPSAPKTQEEAAVADDPTHPVSTPPADPVGALSAVRPTNAAPVLRGRTEPGQRRELATFRDAGAVIDSDRGREIDASDLAKLVLEKHRQFARMTAPGQASTILARAETQFGNDEMLLRDAHEHNFAVLEEVAQHGQALVASGANCAPLTPNYDVFNVAEAMRPIEAALPTVGAPRGGIRYVQPPNWSQAQAGVRFTTAAQETVGYSGHGGSTAVKPCVHLQCRNIVECSVDAISQCVSIGNLQYTTFSELVEVFLTDLAIAFAQAKEVYYLDAIEAGSTRVTFAPPYGATRGSVYAFALAAHGYRKRNHMPVDAPLDVLVPDSMIPLLRADMVNDLQLGLSFVTADAFQVADELFRRLGLNVTFYYDFSTAYGSTGAMQGAQGIGAINKLPTMFRSYIYSPGTWVRLDGGTLDIGLVRDSTLNSINDLQIFSEEWTQLCKRGIESVQLDLTLCPSGTGPSAATPLTCAS